MAHAWLEAAVTRDALANTRGTRMARARVRTWMFVRVRWSAGTRQYEVPRLLAVRGAGVWPDVAPVLRHVEARVHAGREVDHPRRGVVLLAPESSATLVHALLGRLHGEEGRLGAAVGPGYRILDDPTAATGLFGGRSDDAGWGTRPVRIADGERVVGRLAGHGHLWRASYRDLPAAWASNPTLEPVPSASEPDALPVWFDLRIHGLGPDRWMLEGLRADPDGGGGRVRVEVRPDDLPSRCVASAGIPVRCANGVEAPALLVDL